MTTNVELLRTPLSIQVRVAPEAMPMCTSLWRGRMNVVEHIDGARALVELRGYSDYSLAMEIAGLGGDVVVVSVDDASLQVRARLRDIGDALCQMYHSVT